jgi:hypothetical protein
MENARLLTETREAPEQQTATAEATAMSSTPRPATCSGIHDAMLEKAMRLVRSRVQQLLTFDGEHS